MGDTAHELVEELDGQEKMIVYFKDKEMGLVLNKTNAFRIAENHGEETNDWPGKSKGAIT